MKRLDLSSLLVIGATGLSLLVGRDFFFGMLLFMINYFSFKFIIKMMFANNEDEAKALKRYIFIPAVVLKFAAIAIITYIVLVSLEGSPVWYVGGFGTGLLVFTIAVVGDHYFGRSFGRKS
jgi:hypothetical protein